MRVITGTAKGKPLSTLKGDEVRPTTDRVKEGMFSIIQFDILNSKVLDLFAGSGQLGIEALSRGAKMCTFVDNSRESRNIQLQNLKSTNLYKNSRVIFSDSISFLKTTTDKYDIIILDPPYNTDLLLQAIQIVSDKLNDNGMVICEHLKSLNMPENIQNISLQKQYKYGKIRLTTYRKM